MSKWTKLVPDRKWWSGGLFQVAAFAIIMAANLYGGAAIPLEYAAMLAIGLGKAVEWAVPPSWMDVIKRMDNGVVAMAAASPASAVTADVGEAAKAANDAVKQTTANVGELIARIGPGA